MIRRNAPKPHIDIQEESQQSTDLTYSNILIVSFAPVGLLFMKTAVFRAGVDKKFKHRTEWQQSKSIYQCKSNVSSDVTNALFIHRFQYCFEVL